MECNKSCLNTKQMKFVDTTMTVFMTTTVKVLIRTTQKLFKVEKCYFHVMSMKIFALS